MNLPYRFKIVDNVNGKTYQLLRDMDANMNAIYLQLWILNGDHLMGQVRSIEDVEEQITNRIWTVIETEG